MISALDQNGMCAPMLRYIIEDTRHVPPFNQPASQLTIGVKPLKIHQDDVFHEVLPRLMGRLGKGMSLGGTLHHPSEMRGIRGPAIVYRDNLWFDEEFLATFMRAALASKRACRCAIPGNDPAFNAYTRPLATGLEEVRDEQGRTYYMIDLWYFPGDYTHDWQPVLVDSDAEEMGFYSVPDFMTMEQGSLTHYAPGRAVISIESWVHVYFASIICSLFARASRFDRYAKTHNFYSLKLLWSALLEQQQLLSTREVVKVGKNTSIHPTAIITGPASIGDNCNIGPGVFIDNCTIGDNVTIDDGCCLMMSSIGNGCFLPFRAALYLTAVMENTIIAQNTCLQMCVIGRNSFVGAGNTFTDFNLIEQKPIRAVDINGELREVGQVVLGSAIGHNCRIGSGMVMFPGRMIESDVVLVAAPQRRVISRNVAFEESDHHFIGGRSAHHTRHYPRQDEGDMQGESWDSRW
jgi:UDP-N-acetylglucosamine diphosphorylase / glucose-1-phosphate thymidylyltransferase / UDP-N-acetylgalactosamine diphosphorylase / glucosamine-1-phosphate N-acetyltransferase / galactosamine-1-phosphate N-acetyltransferase